MLDITADETTLTNADGTKLFCKYFHRSSHSPTALPRALVFVAHGFAEHCLYYEQLAAELTEEGCFVFAHDHVGHGQSGGDRVHINHFRHYVRDVFQHIDHVRKSFPGVPVFLIGHSMGGAIAILAAMEQPNYFQGVVLIAPAVVPSPDLASPIIIFLGKMVARLFPQLAVVKLDSSAISRDDTVVQRYREDPFVYHGGMKAWHGSTFLDHLTYIQNHLSELTTPFITLHGDADHLTHVDGSKLLAEKAASRDKTIKIYEGFYHQLHNEPGSDGIMVRSEVRKWITERLGQKTASQQ